MSVLPKNKTVLVTGASRGLGAYIGSKLLEQGYEVVGLARTPNESGEFPVIGCDVSDADEVKQAVRIAIKGRSPLAGVVNAAGIASMNLVLSMPEKTSNRIIMTNLAGTINVNKHIGKRLIRESGGFIINFSTIAVSIALAGEAVYAASKAGVETFSRCFAREMSPHNITVNCIAPGPIDTNLIAKVPDRKINRIINQQIFQEKAKPQDVWNIVSLLISPEANKVTGEVISVGGA